MYVDANRLTVRQINKGVAESFVREYHYTGKLSSARYTLGLFYKEESHSFFDGAHERLIGCIVYGHPVSNATVTSVFKTISFELDSILELTRLVILDGHGKNIESYFIGQSFKWLKKHDQRAKELISYADPEQGHTGGIYRATNWYYQGCGAGKLMTDFSSKTLENGEWMHSRTVGSVYGSRNLESLAEKIGHTFWQKQELQKHRYIYFLCTPRERKQYIKDVKVPIIPFNNIKLPIPIIRKIHVVDGKIVQIEGLQGTDSGWTIKRGEYAEEKEPGNGN